MQLGSRWAFGAEPPTRLADAVVAAIREVEQEGGSAADTTASARRWTLTWLEGKPIVELDAAPGSGNVTVIRFNPMSGAATITTGDPGEEWVEE